MYEKVVEDDKVEVLCGDEPIPPFLYHEAYARKMNAGADGVDWILHMRTVWAAANGWKYVFFAAVLFWTFWALFPPIAKLGSFCDGPGFATMRIWPWFVYAPILLTGLFFQWKAGGFLLVAYAHHLGAYTLGRVKLPFKWFLGMIFSLDVVAHADFGTSGAFVGRLSMTMSCTQSLVEEIWARTIAKSSAKFLPSLGVLGRLCWGMMLTQLMFAICMGVPTSHQQLGKLFQADGILNPAEGYPPLVTVGVLHGETGIQEAFFALAESTRSMSVVFRTKAYIYAPDSMIESAKNYDNNIIMYGSGYVQKGVASRSRLATHLAKDVFRTTTFLLFESSIQCNLQATVYAIQKAATGGAPDWLTAISIILSIIMALYNLGTSARNIVSLSRDLWATFPDINYTYDGLRHENPEVEKSIDQKSKRTVVISAVAYAISATMAALLILYALVKFIYAVAVCEQGVWNISGCVEINVADL